MTDTTATQNEAKQGRKLPLHALGPVLALVALGLCTKRST